MHHHQHQANEDPLLPLYKPGTVVHSKDNPAIGLAVITYANGIYYCAVIGNAQNNNLPFLECQLEAHRLEEML